MKIVEKIKLGERGRGRLFKYAGVASWFYSYYQDGHERRVSTGETDFKKAKAFAKARLDAVVADRLNLQELKSPTAAKITVNELLDAYMVNAKVRQLKGLSQMGTHLKPIAAHFGLRRADTVTRPVVDAYIVQLQAEGFKSATINRRIQILTASYKLAGRELKATKLSELGNERRVCYEAGEFNRVLLAADPKIQDLLRFYYATGWRKTSVVLLRWDWVDLAAGTLTVPGTNFKNKKALVLPLTGELAEIIGRRQTARLFERDGEPVVSEYIFHEQGRPQLYFRRLWCKALERAGFAPVLTPNAATGKMVKKYPRTIHDFRRTVSRDGVRAGKSEGIIMGLTGHRTRAIFDRYNFSNTADIAGALVAIEESRAAR